MGDWMGDWMDDGMNIQDVEKIGLDGGRKDVESRE
jgi:hypothetical protein